MKSYSIKSIRPDFQARAAYYDSCCDVRSLAPAEEVITALDNPLEREKFFLPELEEFILEDDKKTLDGYARSLFEGKHWDSLALTIVRAAGKEGRVTMPVIVDNVTKKALVVGPAEIPSADLDERTVYVSAGDPDAVAKINQFLADDVQQRYPRGAHVSFESWRRDLTNAFGMAADFSTEKPYVNWMGRTVVPPIVLPAGTSIGSLAVSIAKGERDVSIYSDAIMPAVKAPAQPKI